MLLCTRALQTACSSHEGHKRSIQLHAETGAILPKSHPTRPAHLHDLQEPPDRRTLASWRYAAFASALLAPIGMPSAS